MPTFTPSSYVILGLLRATGPTTPYALDRTVAAGIGHFWAFPRSQLYAEAARLTRLGLVLEQREAGGRRRRLLTLADPGARALDDWLTTPSERSTQIHDEGLLRLYLCRSDAAADDVLRLAHEQRSLHAARLRQYLELDRSQQLPAGGVRRATLELGLRFERMAEQFWAEVEDGRLPVTGP